MPLVGSGVIAALPASKPLLAKQVAMAASLITLVLTIGMCLSYDTHGAEQYQFVENHSWIRYFGVSYTVGVDGISLALIAMSAIFVPIVLLAALGRRGLDASTLGEGLLRAAARPRDRDGRWSSPRWTCSCSTCSSRRCCCRSTSSSACSAGRRRQYAAVKFLLYSLFGGLLMLAALVGLYVVSGHSGHAATFDFRALTDLTISNGTQKALFLGFFAAFAIKAPMWPVHTWLPDAAAESTPARLSSSSVCSTRSARSG